MIISPISVTGNIVEYAERGNIDLIVIGTRGRSAFKRLLLGSTASGVVGFVCHFVSRPTFQSSKLYKHKNVS